MHKRNIRVLVMIVNLLVIWNVLNIPNDKDIITEVVTTKTKTIEPTYIQPIELTIQNTEQEEFRQPEETIEETQASEPQSYFDSDITFKVEYFNELDTMPYVLFTPSTKDSSQKRPLFVWLHGLGEVNATESAFLNSGILSALTNSRLEGFDSYVICPQLKSQWNTSVWNYWTTKGNLESLLDKFISTHNIDEEKIFIFGHSLGGQGALYMAHEMPNYFSKCVVFSGYWSNVDNNEIEMPTIGFEGKSKTGEDAASIQFMEMDFVPTFGRENIYYLDASHGDVPTVAYEIDANRNNRSDLIEWMLGEIENFESDTSEHTQEPEL